MIDKEQLNQILAFVAKRWTDLSRDPDNKAVKTLPDNFWMNSVGGPAGKGRWITTLMYTEDEAEASADEEVLEEAETSEEVALSASYEDEAEDTRVALSGLIANKFLNSVK